MQRLLITPLLLMLSVTPLWAGQHPDVTRGLIAVQFGQNETAIGHFTQALETGNLSAQDERAAYYSRGLAKTRLGQYKNSLADFTAAIKVMPDDGVSYYNRGRAYDLMGELDKAIEDYGEAIRLRPDLWRPFNNRCYARAKLGEYEEGQKDCEQALRMEPGDPYATHSMGFVLEGLGDTDAAIAHYHRALGANPLLKEAREDLARLGAL